MGTVHITPGHSFNVLAETRLILSDVYAAIIYKMMMTLCVSNNEEGEELFGYLNGWAVNRAVRNLEMVGVHCLSRECFEI